MYDVIPGMLANCALLANLFFTLGILASFQSALTMPGIAGIVLTLGTAVDANVLIYERIKEEMRAGKGIKDALQAGYSNAFSAIFDSNFTSLITGIILLVTGTGPIRGFATTWIIGIICSFFTAVYLTRIVFENRLGKDKWLNQKFYTSISKNLMRNMHIKFMSFYKTTFTISAIVAVVFLVSIFFVRGLSKSIDFTGGRNYVITLNKKVHVEDFEPSSYPVAFWDIFGENGINIRTTISEMGPILLSQLLGLNETQEGILNIAFKVADEQGLLLIDIKDLRAMLNYVGAHASELRNLYGNIAQ